MQIPIIPALIKVYKTTKKYIFLWGGRGSGKSVGIAHLLLAKSRSEKATFLCTREIQKSIQESVYGLLKDLIEKWYAGEYEILKTEIININTGSRFIFSGLLGHTIDSIKSYTNVKYCWIEEAHAVSEGSLTILIPTLRDEGTQFYFTFNRKKERDPVYSRAMKMLCNEQECIYDLDGQVYKWIEFENEDAIGIFMNYDANPYFPETLEKERVKMEKDDPSLYLHVWGGLPIQQSELAILSRQSVMEAMKRDVPDDGGYVIGCDVARFGDDRTVIFKRKGQKVLSYKVLKHKDVVEVVRAIEGMAGN